jgi:hypothetical protein
MGPGERRCVIVDRRAWHRNTPSRSRDLHSVRISFNTELWNEEQEQQNEIRL